MIDIIEKAVARLYCLDIETLRNGRNRHACDARKTVAAIAQNSGYEQKQIARYLGTSQPNVSSMVAKHHVLVNVDPAYRRLNREINKQLDHAPIT